MISAKILKKMKTTKSKAQKWWLPATVVALIILSIIIVLAGNKKKIDDAKKPVDRSRLPVAVSVAQASVALLGANTQYPALIQPLDEAQLYAQTSGIIATLHIQLGKQVKKGQILGRLDTRILEINLKNARISQQAAAVNRDKLAEDYNRSIDLYQNKAGLEVNMLTAKNNYQNALNTYENSLVQIDLIRQQIANANIVAPLSGTISMHKVKQGEFVNPGTAVASIADISKVKATVFVDQQMSYKLGLGDQALVTAPLFANQTFSGTVVFISPVADANHNYQVDLLIAQTRNVALRGGTDVQVSFQAIAQKEALQVPKSAILTDTKEPYVFVSQDGKAIIKKVRTGLAQNDMVEILAGLKPGEQVITSGQINLKEGSIINILK